MTQSVTQSFAALQTLLNVGQEVKVREEAGRSVRGKVVSISSSQLVVARRQFWFPYFRPRKEEVFAEDVVESVDIVDSVWNGALIGAAGGAPFLVHAILQFDRDENLSGLPLMLYGLPAIMMGVTFGSVIDGRINQTIYRQTQTPRVTLAPVLGRDQKGIVAHVRF